MIASISIDYENKIKELIAMIEDPEEDRHWLVMDKVTELREMGYQSSLCSSLLDAIEGYEDDHDEDYVPRIESVVKQLKEALA